MLKEPDLAKYPTRRTHRTYTAEFKAELVAACQISGASIAAIAGQHGMNANVLHRWLKEHQQSGRHQRIVCSSAAQSLVTSPSVAIGRNNWLFAGSLRAGKRAAAVMSLIQSARLNGHDPYAYLKDVLTRLPTQRNSQIADLLPHRWQPQVQAV